MNNNKPVYLNHMAMINALGFEHSEILKKLMDGDTSGMVLHHSKLTAQQFLVGKINSPLPELDQKRPISRNNQLVLHCLQQLQQPINSLKKQCSAHRIGVVMGTSTSGIAEGEIAIQQQMNQGHFADSFSYSQIEMYSPAEFITDQLDLAGPAYAISTACSSSGKVFASARSLIQNGLCDAVIVGGADTLCDMTLNGFNALDAISPTLSQPFSVNRNGINIGEGAALFIMTAEPSSVELLGVGESSDAHHISAPHPQGEGAARAMAMALKEADLAPDCIDYLNLHGTATQLNDAMESHAVVSALNDSVPSSSTKPLTGHTLGAAGATEAAFCWLLLNNPKSCTGLPIHCFDQQLDPSLAPLSLVTTNEHRDRTITTTMSNSFAFGGNNVSVILGRSKD